VTSPAKRRRESEVLAMMAVSSLSREGNLHVCDLPYRLSSPALDNPDNVGLWFASTTGALLGWAVMQTPFWAIDYAMHPDASPSLHRAILEWADGRARALLDSPWGRPQWYVNVFADQTDRLHDLVTQGFADQASVGPNSWQKVLLVRSPRAPIESSQVPVGFVIRPLDGTGEVEAYVELHRDVFQSKAMTVEWRRRTLAQPAYRPDLDLVAVAPDGKLVGFCVSWLSPEPDDILAGQIEPLGVHPEYRGIGLGKALLAAGLAGMLRYGAETIYVETDKHRDAALDLYLSAGFRIDRDVRVYRKDVRE